ncbi:hypothetical protein [Lysobacter sp. Root494]|uniref:hypothetical protein n=1 Tax=Lysobacter sp. Root494 TaxID=1736549 RepID=UPI0006F37B5C|nr:hypothetical protein [Lysobacter sp. Root494]KQY55118.1 hypothetical protein ASD14_02885 [Lysobacter sp. Root494]
MRLPSALIAALLLTLAACAAPAPTSPDSSAQPAPSSGPSVQPAPASPTGPATAAGQPLATSPSGAVTLDHSCKTDADCAVKNVGNCCGYYPACVNVNSPTDPKGVQAECAKNGMMSVCGFQDISSCSCKQGQCEAGPAQALQ